MWLSLALLLAAAQAAASLPERLTLVQQMIERSDLAGARKELLLASKLFPGHPIIANFLGVLDAQEGNYREAERHFRAAVAEAPRYTDAHLNLGRLYQENSARDGEALAKALQAYGAILAYEPDHAEANYQSAALLQARGDFDGSLRHLERLPAAARRRAPALAVRCAGLVGTGRHGEADEVARSLASHADLSELEVLSILPTLTAKARDDLAQRLLEAVRDRRVGTPEGLQRLGLLYERQGALDRARETLEAAAQHRPDSVELLLHVARIAHRQRDHRGALGYLAHARDLAPADARIHFFFGMVCVDLDLGQEAYTSLKEAVRLAPDNAYVNYAMGAVSIQRRDPSEAVPYFRRFGELRPEDPRGPFAIGVALFKAGDYAGARETLARAVLHRETRPGAHYFRARMAREENDLEAAASETRKALEADPAYADAWAELGLLHVRRKEHEEAEKALRKCLAIDADNYLGNFHLLMLYQRTRDPREADQEQRFEELKKRREEKAEEFFRIIEVRPY